MNAHRKCLLPWRQHFLKWDAATTAPAGSSVYTPPLLLHLLHLQDDNPLNPPKLRNVFPLKQVCLKGDCGSWRREMEYQEKWSGPTAEWLQHAPSIRAAEREKDCIWQQEFYHWVEEIPHPPLFLCYCVDVSPLPPAEAIIPTDLPLSSLHTSRFISRPGQPPGEVITNRGNTGLPGRSLSESAHLPLS